MLTQKEKDNAIRGLTDAAVTMAVKGGQSIDDIDKLRDTVSELVEYWSLDLLIDQFDIEVDDILSSEGEPGIGGFSYNQQC